MRIFAKIKWIAGILLVFFIVLVTNLIDRDNFNRLSYSVTTLYEDRIVASDIIFKISRIVKEKQLAALTSDTLFFQNKNPLLNQEIDQLISNFNLTKLTEKEDRLFDQLQNELGTLQQKEVSLAQSSNKEVLKSIEKIDEYLYKLSEIQLLESKQQVFISNRAIDTVNFYTQIEIILLIVMAILVQIIILYKPKE
ncbi:chemotaxis protein [Cytophagales bacterium LB-30]|uniref:Chemotaxis protein n=1 Tax=Shiella aurantiaca TaxID=3058365 RepID=A0ABT8F4X6_9BACT|nr:chemotaxis protein [Shiella aurantiaca]MDN4165036.1 chemotaxis protein [Shiella aurantiaca]